MGPANFTKSMHTLLVTRMPHQYIFPHMLMWYASHCLNDKTYWCDIWVIIYQVCIKLVKIDGDHYFAKKINTKKLKLMYWIKKSYPYIFVYNLQWTVGHSYLCIILCEIDDACLFWKYLYFKNIIILLQNLL
jgi:hypothetical protein